MAYEINFLESYGRDSIAAELRRVAALLGKQSLSTCEIDHFARVNSRTVAMKFGSLRVALHAAGLALVRYQRTSDDQLLRIVIDLWDMTQKDHGRIPRRLDVAEYGFRVSGATIAHRFGSWRKALIAASKLAREQPEARTGVPVRTRLLVLKRDSWQCRSCGHAGGTLEVDHILPVSQGGLNDPDNLQTLCFPCNQEKRAAR